MEVGISTACFYPEPTEKGLEKVVRAGIPAAEVFLNTFSEAEPDFIGQLREILKQGDTRVLSLHPFTGWMEPMLFFTGYQRRFQDGLELFKRLSEAALMLGTDLLVFHGDNFHADRSPESYAECFGRLFETGKQCGVRIVQENVCRCASKNPELFPALIHQIPDCGFTLDVKQALRSGVTAMEVYEKMGGHLAHLHLSDSSPQETCLLPGEGTFDFRRFFERLRQDGYRGNAVVEVYHHNFREEKTLFDSVWYLRKIAAEVFENSGETLAKTAGN